MSGELTDSVPADCSANAGVPRTTESGNNPNGLRERIAQVLWRVFQDIPPGGATDEEWESWWHREGDWGRQLYYNQADAVIAALGLTISHVSGREVCVEGFYVTKLENDE